MKKNIKILIRFDDICPTMNWKEWNKAYELLEHYGKKPLIGVIPECKDPDLQIEKANENFWNDILKLQEKGYKIAMHGYQHIFESNSKGIVNNRNGSEFSGIDYEKQLEKIRKGKQILRDHGIETDIFFAPAHSYDINTLRALKEEGFKYISDGKSSKPIEREGIICLPCRFGGCPDIKRNGFYTAVFHAHEWVKKDKAVGYKKLKNLLENYSDNIVEFDKIPDIMQGNKMYGLIEEKIYVIYEYSVHIWIMKIKHMLKRIIMK
ncbi:DUF2334 domain-containing protein [Eubacterium sp.]|uniref:DUF2334 domain-containing protein n=1 Tax=Eubacterium sp. TaxID=142586 RepID=UPI003521E1F0